MNQQVNPQTVAKLKELSIQLSPQLSEVVKLLRDMGLHEFEIGINSEGDSFHWSSGLIGQKTISQQQLETELIKILDNEYPMNVLMFMGMVYSPNRNVAQTIAEIVAEHRRRDRSQVASQLVALLAAFQLNVPKPKR